MQFHPIGFWLPCLVAVFYGCLCHRVRFWDVLVFTLSGVLTYFTDTGTDGVHLMPVALLAVALYAASYLILQTPPEKRLPAGVAYFLSFVSMAIPDAIWTAQKYGPDGTVGIRGFEDGLFFSSVAIYVVAVAGWMIVDRFCETATEAPFTEKEPHKEKKSFNWKASLWLHFACTIPLPEHPKKVIQNDWG